MQSKSSPKGLLYFTLLNLFPLVILAACFTIYSLVLNASLSFKRHAVAGMFYSMATSITFFVFFWIVFFLVLSVMISLCYRIFKKYKSWLIRAAVLYLFWAVVLFIGLYLHFALFTGISMAYFDASAHGKQLMELQAQEATTGAFLVSHAGIVPWVLFCLFMIKRFMRDDFNS